MCIIQSTYFTKNGTVEWGNCNALLSDAIRCEAVVTMSGAELGLMYYAGWQVRRPDGLMTIGSSDIIVGTPTTVFTQYYPFDNLISGVYTLISVDIFKKEVVGGTLMCTG